MCDEQRKIAYDHNARGRTGGAGYPGVPPAQGNYANQLSDIGEGPSDAGGPTMPSIRERLFRERQDLTHRLTVVQTAIIALEGDPEFEKHQRTRDAVKAAGVYMD